VSAIPGIFDDLSITASDGTGTPVTASASLLTGSLSVEGLAQDGREVIVFESQGVVVGLRKATRRYVTLSIQAFCSTPLDALRKLVLGETASTTSTTTAIGDAFTVDLQLGFNLTSPSSETRTIVLEDCVCTVAIEAAERNTATIEVTCYGKVTLTDAGGTTITLRSGL
jgi:hypothetical protein